MKKFLVLIVFVSLIGGGYLGVNAINKAGDEKDALQVMYTVERGPLSINLTETGTIKSRDQHIVKSQVEGRTSIIYVIDEGTVVKEGDLLVELDSSELEDRLVDQQIKVENTDADFISSKETLAVTKIQNQSNIARAQQDNQFAIEDKVKYLDGDWPKLLMKAESDVTLSDEDFRRATDEFVWSEKLFNEKYLSETEYRADELSKKRSELQVALAREDLRLLREFTHIRKLTELDSEIEQKALALERVKRECASSLVQAQARERASGAELQRQKTRLVKLEDQISKTKIYAPADGMVVYATSSQFSWRGDTQPLDEGQEVRERQELIHLPTADSMMVEIRIHETALGKVKMDQAAEITIDALPGQTFVGRVTRIAPLPDANSVFMNPDLKVYDTQILIDGIYPEIRTGMSCKAKILIDEFDDALSVPIQAVVGRDGESVVYVANGKQNLPRVVETGLDNNAMVHVISGLQAGDEVLLTPPLTEDPSKDNAKSKAEDSKPSAVTQKKLESKPSGRPSGRPSESQPIAGSMP